MKPVQSTITALMLFLTASPAFPEGVGIECDIC